MTTTDYTFGNYNVSFALEEDHPPLGKLEDLHICHLGMKFVSACPMPEFAVYEFEIAVRPVRSGAKATKLKCCGGVVKSEPEGSSYRTVIHFADMGKAESACLEAVTKAQKMRCEYCENC